MPIRDEAPNLEPKVAAVHVNGETVSELRPSAGLLIAPQIIVHMSMVERY
jgi:hypothetical protein